MMRQSRLGAVLRGLGAATQDETNFGFTEPLGQQYFDRMESIHTLIEGEAAPIAAVAAKAAEALERGSTVYVNLVIGHVPGAETANEREGNPGFFRHTASDEWEPATYAAMAKGDVLVTQFVDERVRAARERGVYVAVVTTPYVKHRGTPEGKVVVYVGDERTEATLCADPVPLLVGWWGG